MRYLIALALLTTPAHAWDFTPSPICTLAHIENTAEMTITYDHTTRLYAIAVTNSDGWPAAPAFSIRFDGPRPGTISTTRHETDGPTLTVSDIGFGNVLDGLEFNTTATAFTQTAAVTVSLDGAAPEVQKFRACAMAPVA
ncbi:hypothetical protein [Tateyamaria sp. ANG-S1]|uniref:hypothetical protein n=1 Tax=Tateyamaria sp. ANG-S1 TaxID=1577905 RepID=UPI00057C7ACF|nr:hypothetical protein [Tateyamaria sp. ANG-S1]KIC50137.1 hypothetical protein RA29_11185 [Tateyamaria sp. ANG-S1]